MTTAATRPRPELLAHVLVPVTHRGLRTALQLAAGVALLALLAHVRVAIGPVPITGQTLGVLLIAAAGGARLGVATVASYLAAGLAGLPAFAGAAGAAALGGPTAGYLVGFLVAAALVGTRAERGATRRPLATAGAMVLGNLAIYACGVAWLTRFAPDLSTALAWGVWPFLPGDALKLALAVALLPTAWRLLRR